MGALVAIADDFRDPWQKGHEGEEVPEMEELATLPVGPFCVDRAMTNPSRMRSPRLAVGSTYLNRPTVPLGTWTWLGGAGQ